MVMFQHYNTFFMISDHHDQHDHLILSRKNPGGFRTSTFPASRWKESKLARGKIFCFLWLKISELPILHKNLFSSQYSVSWLLERGSRYLCPKYFPTGQVTTLQNIPQSHSWWLSSIFPTRQVIRISTLSQFHEIHNQCKRTWVFNKFAFQACKLPLLPGVYGGF